MHSLMDQLVLGLVRRLLHVFKQAASFIGGQARIKNRQIDFLFLGEVHLDQRIQAYKTRRRSLICAAVSVAPDASDRICPNSSISRPTST